MDAYYNWTSLCNSFVVVNGEEVGELCQKTVLWLFSRKFFSSFVNPVFNQKQTTKRVIKRNLTKSIVTLCDTNGGNLSENAVFADCGLLFALRSKSFSVLFIESLLKSKPALKAMLRNINFLRFFFHFLVKLA